MRIALAAVILLVAAAVGVVGATSDRDPLVSDVETPQAYVLIEGAQPGPPVVATVTVVELTDRTVRSPRAGTITAVDVQAESMLATGTPVAHIDDIVVLAHVGAAPISVAVSESSPSSAVFRLQELLSDLSVDGLTPDGRWGSQTRSGVAQVVQRYTGQRRSTVFPADLVAWVGDQSLTVSSTEVVIGDRVEEGQTLARGDITAAVVRVATATGSALDDLTDWRLQVEDAEVPIGPDLSVLPEDAAALLAGRRVLVDDVLEGVLVRAEALPTAVLPVAALVTDGATSCLAIRRDGELQAMTVDVARLGVGQVEIVWQPEDPLEVALDPGSIEGFACPPS